jgi:hypothetical protein
MTLDDMRSNGVRSWLTTCPWVPCMPLGALPGTLANRVALHLRSQTTRLCAALRRGVEAGGIPLQREQVG